MIQKAGKKMLESQDKTEIRQMIKEETSDLRQDVSILKQDVSILKQDVSELKIDMAEVKRLQTKTDINMEILNHKFDTFTEVVIDIRDQLLESKETNRIVRENHSPRITALELAVKKKRA